MTGFEASCTLHLMEDFAMLKLVTVASAVLFLASPVLAETVFVMEDLGPLPPGFSGGGFGFSIDPEAVPPGHSPRVQRLPRQLPALAEVWSWWRMPPREATP